MRYITIERLARNILSSNGDLSNDGLSRMLYTLKPIVDALSDYISPNIRSEIFILEDNLTITLPDHVVAPIKVGKIIDGRIYHFGLDPRIRDLNNIPISPYTVVNEEGTCACSPISEAPPANQYVNSNSDLPENLPDSYIFHNYENHGSRGEVYGLKQKQFRLGTYRYDSKMRRFEFGSGASIYKGSEILIEYIMDDDKERYRMIPADAYNLVRHKAMQMYAESDGNLGMARHHRVEYEKELDIYENRHDMTSPIDIVGALVYGNATIN